MVRQATAADLDQIADAYEEHFAFEETHPAQAFTVFKRGVYPTRRDAEKALADGGLTVYEEDGRILASVITSGQQPPEYANVVWQRTLPAEAVRVIHLLMVRPSASRRGIGAQLMRYVEDAARETGCAALRLEHGQSEQARRASLRKTGYQIVAGGAMKVGGAVPHDGHLFLEKIL